MMINDQAPIEAVSANFPKALADTFSLIVDPRFSETDFELLLGPTVLSPAILGTESLG